MYSVLHFFRHHVKKNDPSISVTYAQVPDSNFKNLEKTIRHTLRISRDAEQQEKHVKKLKNGCMQRYKMHIRGLVEDGIPVPKSHSSASFVVSPVLNKVRIFFFKNDFTAHTMWYTTQKKIIRALFCPDGYFPPSVPGPADNSPFCRTSFTSSIVSGTIR